MSLLTYKLLAGLLIFLTSIAAVIYPIKVRAQPQHNPLLELGDAFASGIFLGTALFHMLPEANAQFNEVFASMHYPIAELFAAIGFLLLLFLERLSQYTRGKSKTIHSIPYILTLILIIHALIEGAALGINTTLTATAILFIAIIAHKSSESFALAVILNRSNISLRRVITIVSLFALMTPFGILLGAALTQSLQIGSGLLLAAGFNAFAAGTFLYISTLHHINHHHREHEGENLWEFVALSVGIFVMAILAWWA